jgi:hypothetical protein
LQERLATLAGRSWTRTFTSVPNYIHSLTGMQAALLREPMVRAGGLVAPDVRASTIDSDDSVDAAVVVDVPDSLAMDTLIY